MNVLTFLAKNWDSVLVIVAFLAVVVVLIKRGETKILKQIFCENWQNPVKQRITPHFLTTSPSNYYEFTTKE